VLLYDEAGVLVATGAALSGTIQPCVLIPQVGQTVGMVDADLGWHMLLTTTGTESQREIRIAPSVDLPDEIHPIYGDDDLALVRATAGIDASAHYIDDLTVSCPLGLGAALWDVASVPVDGAAVVGQVESITWTATPDGASEQAAIRRHVAIAPEPFVEPEPVVPPIIADDTGSTDASTATSGNVFDNDSAELTVVAINGLSANVGATVNGDNGGSFEVNADGSWTFDPDGEFDGLTGSEIVNTSVAYHASDGMSESQGTLTISVSRVNASPIAMGDNGETPASATTSGNVLANDTDADLDTLFVSRVNGSASNVGVSVAGSNGGLFTIGSEGNWLFDPNGEFDGLTGDQTAITSVTYSASDGLAYDDAILTVTVFAGLTGVQLVDVAAGTGLSADYAITLPTGLLEGDLVIVATGFYQKGNFNPGVVSPAGYTEVADLWADDSGDTNLSVSYKFMGATPDTSVTVTGSASVSYGAATAICVFRGVDQSSPLDVSSTTTVGVNSADANPAAITPVTSGALILVIAGWTNGPLNSDLVPSGFAHLTGSSPEISANYATKIASKGWVDGDGTIDPGTGFGGGTSGTASWAAVTMALRPA
jgi:VCBS repeat-containing protein